MSKRILATLVAVVSLLTACSDGSDDKISSPPAAVQSYPITINSGNHATTIEKKPSRIVSLSPTATENLFAIDAGSQVVAVDNQSTYPATAPKTDLSGFTPNAEAIIGYKPDLVVIQNDANGLLAALTAANVDVLVQPSASTLDDVYEQIANLGAATDHLTQATAVTSGIKADIAAEVAKVKKSATPLTYYHEVDSALYSATSSTFIGSVYSLFGLQNIADPAGTAANQYPQLSNELIVQANPDLIFLADTKCCAQSRETVAARPGWAGLKAVTNNAVIPLDDDIASRWSPRVVDLVETVGTAVSSTAK